MYKHIYTKDDNISLHDCRASKAEYKNGRLSFYFPDGFWICSGHEENKSEKTVRTDAAEVHFHTESEEESDVNIYIFTKRKHGKTIREEWSINKFMSTVNSDKCELEFLYQYKGYNSRIIECWLWLDKKPYYKECWIKIRTDRVTYCYNTLCEDKIW